MKPEQASALRAPFPTTAIGHMPKGGTMLAYVGHAAVTQRLLEVDPSWTWEPVAFGADGLPVLDEQGGLWIRLTIAEVTRLGYGHANGKKGPDAIKEAIGDAIRNAAMRFGVALDLWAKEDITATLPPVKPAATNEQIAEWDAHILTATTVAQLQELAAVMAAHDLGAAATSLREAYLAKSKELGHD